MKKHFLNSSLPYRRLVVVADDFYTDPDAVRTTALAMSYYEPRWLTGLRSRKAYYPPDTRKRLEAAIGMDIVGWKDDPEIGHGVFYKTFAAGPQREVPRVHYDEPVDRLTAVLYLTPGLPPDCGTSLWMHRRIGVTDAPNAADARRLRLTLRRLDRLIEKSSRNRSSWIEVDRIGYRYNRLVCYPSGMLHSATRHFGTADHNVRLYQTFRLRVNWKHRVVTW